MCMSECLYVGTTRVDAAIYVWRYDDQVVVSDLDGTITRSDVLGHVSALTGVLDWTQPHVAELFTNIAENGYRVLYLTARALGQASHTSQYLRGIVQGENTLPDGPLLMNPSSLVHAFKKEVIERKPEEFKIACLQQVKALFPARQPFYSGICPVE